MNGGVTQPSAERQLSVDEYTRTFPDATIAACAAGWNVSQSCANIRKSPLPSAEPLPMFVSGLLKHARTAARSEWLKQ